LETGWLVGDVVELPGCHTEAPDLASLRVNLDEAIAVYLAGENADETEPTSEFVGTLRIEVAEVVRATA
jgi:predicted RNase H-like HicB family nuclease